MHLWLVQWNIHTLRELETRVVEFPSRFLFLIKEKTQNDWCHPKDIVLRDFSHPRPSHSKWKWTDHRQTIAQVCQYCHQSDRESSYSLKVSWPTQTAVDNRCIDRFFSPTESDTSGHVGITLKCVAFPASRITGSDSIPNAATRRAHPSRRLFIQNTCFKSRHYYYSLDVRHMKSTIAFWDFHFSKSNPTEIVKKNLLPNFVQSIQQVIKATTRSCSICWISCFVQKKGKGGKGGEREKQRKVREQ